MGIFTSPKQRLPYVPPLGRDNGGPADATSSPATMLGGAPPAENDWLSRLAPTPPGDREPDLNIVLAANPDPVPPVDDVQIAQQRLPQPRPPAQQPAPSPSAAQLMAQPGRGYGEVPQEQIELDRSTNREMSPVQKSINRNQALLEFAGRPLAPGVIKGPLPDNWERTKPSEVVDDLKRAAQRQGVPLQAFARMMYQEGKFNEPENLPRGRLLVMQSTDPRQPIGWAQMTTETFNDLKKWARDRGDTARAKELEGYSLANRAQAFDVAAEYLAYARRLTGSWPAAVAGYNFGPTYMQRWLNGLPPTEVHPVPERFATRTRETGELRGRWVDMTNYIANAFRDSATNPQIAGRYAPGNPMSGFRVAAPVPRNPNAPDIWRIPRDAKENP